MEKGAYDGAGDAHALEFLLVLGAGFGAVVCYEDDLFACLVRAVGERWLVRRVWKAGPLLRSISSVSTVPSNR